MKPCVLALLLISFYLLLPPGAVAQEAVVENLSASTISTPRMRHWGVGFTGGYDRNYHSVDMSYMSDMKYREYMPGSSFGFRIAYSPLKWLTLRAEAVKIQKNYHMDHVFTYYNLRYSLPTTTTNDYFNVPVELMLNVGRSVKLHAFGGGYWGYWLSSHRKGTTYSFSNSRLIDFDEDYEFNDKRDNREEYGFTYGAGLSTTVFKGLELGAEVRWYYSVTDIQKPYMRHLNPRYNTTMVLQGGITYWL